MFQTWPVYVSLNPEYLKMLLQPVLAYLTTGAWPDAWVIHDLGTRKPSNDKQNIASRIADRPFGIDYPSAIGHDNGVAEQMPLFETSAVFIMLYAYEKYTGDTSFAAEYSSLLAGYADYLNDNSLYPASQLISVDSIPAQANQTGLAIQSAIGLKAASLVLGDSTYSDTANTIAKSVYNDALGLDGATLAESTHFTYYYGQDDTWNVLFPAYSDVLLELGTFDSAAWDMRSTWYSQQMQEGGLPFASPITDTSYTGSGINWGLADWSKFALLDNLQMILNSLDLLVAATVSEDVQAEIVNTTHAFLTNGLNSIPFGTKYYVEGDQVGVWIGNEARSTVGLSFGLLALDQGYWGDSYCDKSL